MAKSLLEDYVRPAAERAPVLYSIATAWRSMERGATIVAGFMGLAVVAISVHPRLHSAGQHVE